MLESDFAKRLLFWGNAAVLAGLLCLLLGGGLAYALAKGLPHSAQVLGHLLVGVGAFGLKGGYIARLAGLDVLRPHPEGWLSESGPRAPARG